MVADGDAVERCSTGDDGLLAGAAPGLVWLEMCDDRPDRRARSFAARAPSAGVAMLDAPVSGSVAVAEPAGAGGDGRR